MANPEIVILNEKQQGVVDVTVGAIQARLSELRQDGQTNTGRTTIDLVKTLLSSEHAHPAGPDWLFNAVIKELNCGPVENDWPLAVIPPGSNENNWTEIRRTLDSHIFVRLINPVTMEPDNQSAREIIVE